MPLPASPERTRSPELLPIIDPLDQQIAEVKRIAEEAGFDIDDFTAMQLTGLSHEEIIQFLTRPKENKPS